jgi:uncharacterized protein YndB with AHSA1/START domain
MTRLRVTRRYPAPIEEVFAAWTDAESMAEWMNVEPGPAHSVELDVRVGGRIRIWMGRDRAAQIEITGEYVEVAPPHRLAFTWRGTTPPGTDSLVTVTFARLSGEETELVLEHERLPTEQSAKGHEAGWLAITARLGQRWAANAGSTS